MESKTIISLVVAILIFAYLAPTALDHLYNTSSDDPNASAGDWANASYEINDTNWDSAAQNLWGVLGILLVIAFLTKIYSY